MHESNIDYLVLGPIETNTYFVSDPDTGECVIIDPAANPEAIISKLEKDRLKLTAMLLTHGHFDHIMAVNELKRKYGVPVYVHEAESVIMEDPGGGLMRIGLSDIIVRDYGTVHDGDTLNLAGARWKVIHTPGHSAGSVCYCLPDEKVIFSGDTLFLRSFGRTDLKTGNFREIINSLTNILFKIPDDDIDVYPGHGGFTTLGYEKKHNDILIDS